MDWFTSLSDIITGLLKGSEERQDKIFERISQLPGDDADRKKLYEAEIKNLQGEVMMRRTIVVFMMLAVAALLFVYLILPAGTDFNDAAKILINEDSDDNKYSIIEQNTGSNYVTYNGKIIGNLNFTLTVDPPNNKWIALDVNSRKIIHPEVQALAGSNEIDSLVLGSDDPSGLENDTLSITKEIMGIKVSNPITKIAYGNIPFTTLKENNFFNSLDDATKDENIREVTYKKVGVKKSSKWSNSTVGNFFNDSPFEVSMANSGIGSYEIIKSGTNDQSGKRYSIDDGQREMHFFKPSPGNKDYYLLYVDAAKNNDTIVSNNFVKFVQIKLKPDLN